MQMRYGCLFDCLQRTAVQRSNKTLILMLLAHTAIPIEDLQWLHEFMSDVNNPVPLNNALCIMRKRLFPFHYDPYTRVKEDGRQHLK